MALLQTTVRSIPHPAEHFVAGAAGACPKSTMQAPALWALEEPAGGKYKSLVHWFNTQNFIQQPELLSQHPIGVLFLGDSVDRYTLTAACDAVGGAVREPSLRTEDEFNGLSSEQFLCDSERMRIL